MAKTSANQGSRLMRLPFPIKGTDQGWALADQPPLTTPNLQNVRALDWRNRQGGGKRHGHSKALSTAAGVLGNTRVNGLSSFSAASGSPTGNASVVVTIADDFSTYPIAVPTDLGDNWVYTVHQSNGAGLADARANFGTTANGLAVSIVTAQRASILAARFVTTNDVTATLRCAPRAGSSNTNNGVADDCQAFGPFIRGKGDLRDIIVAVLRRNALDTAVILNIERWVDGAQTILASSASQTIGGGAVVVEDLTIRLYESGANMVAVMNWPSQTLSNVTATSSSSQNSTYSRAGLVVANTTSFNAATFRTFVSVAMTMLRPASPNVAHLMTRSLAGSNRYYIPAGWTSVANNHTAGTQSLVAGAYDSASIAGGAAPVGQIDTNTSQFRAFQTTVGAQRSGGIFQTTETGGPFDVEFQLAVNNAATSDYLGVALRADDTFQSYIYVEPRIATGSATQNTTEIGLFGQIDISQVAALVFTTLVSSLTNQVVPFRCGASWIRVTDNGFTVTISVDGHLVASYGTAVFATQTRTGMAVVHAAAAGVNGLEAFRLISRSGFIDIGEARPLVAVYTSGRVYIGDIDANTLQPTSGTGLTNQFPQAFAFNLKWYAVDGLGAVITDPALLATTDWANAVTVSGNGTLPALCRLSALYRGRAVLARTPSQPWMWFMSRVAFPLDWDFLNANANGGIPTAANYGTNADVGVPGDTITCLAPFSDDYLIFGCSKSIWMMEGDPGYGGAVQNVSYLTGIVGPRAFAFDEDGNMYFIGAAGLYKMQKGTRDPVNITGRKLINLLDILPLDRTLVQMAWDATGGYLNIYLTPTDNLSVGTHCIYDPKDKSFWLDQMPVVFGPWGVCEINGVADADRRVLLGGDDGYIRRPDRDRFTDDGTAIDSWVEIGPFELENGTMYSMVQEVQAMLGAGSEAVTWYWFTGDSPEEVAAQTFGQEVATGTWSNPGSVDGFQPPVGLRQTGGAHKVRVRQNTNSETGRWSLEKINALLVPTGRRRL